MKKIKFYFLIISLVLSGVFSSQVFALISYDDFSSSTIDPNRWNNWEYVREIRNGQLFSRTSAYGSTVNTNRLYFKNPTTINYFEADVTLTTADGSYDSIDPNKYAYSFAGLTGFFYNDGTGSSGSYVGDVQAQVRIGWLHGQLLVTWAVQKYLDVAGYTFSTLGSGSFTVSVSLEHSYKLSILWEPNLKKFTFKVDSETQSWTSSQPQIYTSNINWKALRTYVFTSDSNQWGTVSATFDNVLAKDESGNVLMTDDFSSAQIDPAKWDNYEFVQDIENGKLVIKMRSNNEAWLRFKNPDRVNEFQAKVTINAFNNPNGVWHEAGIGGVFYNAAGDPNSGFVGDVWAQASIGGSATSPVAFWRVIRFTNTGASSYTVLGGGVAPIPINVGSTYTVYLKWDRTKFTFQCTNQTGSVATAYYTPSTSIFPPNNKIKRLNTGIYPNNSISPTSEDFISVTVDDVMIGPIALPFLMLLLD